MDTKAGGAGVRECMELVAHMDGLMQRRLPAWRELSAWICPWRGVFDGTTLDRFERDDIQRFTHAAASACLRGASGMTSGMTPRNISWFKPEFSDGAMAEASGARAWLDALDMRIKDTLANGGFYQAIQNFNLDLIWSGCALLYTEKGEDTALRYESVQVGTFRVAVGLENRLTAVARLLSMTVAEAARIFGRDKLSDDSRRKLDREPWTPLRIWHLCRADKPYNQRLPVSSWYWEENGRDFLRHAGFFEMPFFYTVWNEGATPYGTGPGDTCLADARQMDYLERNKLNGLGKLVNPPVSCPMHLKDVIDLEPGGINYTANAEQIKPLLDLGPYATSLRSIQEEIKAVSQRLESGLMASIFASMPLDQRPRDMSATEFLERKREALQQMGPVISAYEPTVLVPLLFRTVQSLDRAGLTPPVPQSLEGRDIFMKMEFISPMANALRQTGAETTRALFQDIANMYTATQNPELFDKVDMDQMIDELATGIGAPGSVIRSDEDVEKLRQQRQQAQQQQMLLAMAAEQQGAAMPEGIG